LVPWFLLSGVNTATKGFSGYEVMIYGVFHLFGKLIYAKEFVYFVWLGNTSIRGR
jgi:hypothetical protein